MFLFLFLSSLLYSFFPLWLSWEQLTGLWETVCSLYTNSWMNYSAWWKYWLMSDTWGVCWDHWADISRNILIHFVLPIGCVVYSSLTLLLILTFSGEELGSDALITATFCLVLLPNRCVFLLLHFSVYPHWALVSFSKKWSYSCHKWVGCRSDWCVVWTVF